MSNETTPKIDATKYREYAEKVKAFGFPLAATTVESINEAADEIENWHNSFQCAKLELEQEQRAHAATKAELARMREALGKYANHDNWAVLPDEDDESQASRDWWQEFSDGWEVAENALKGGAEQ